MLLKKERVFWILLVIVATLATFYLTKRLSIQNLPLGFSFAVTTDKNGKTAEDWFTSDKNLSIPSRSLFETSIELDSFNKFLLDPSVKESWCFNSPQCISLTFFGYLEFSGYAPDELITYYGYNDSSIVTIVMRRMQATIIKESRIDLMYTYPAEQWKAIWAAERIISLK